MEQSHQGLQRQIRYVEEKIAIKKKLGNDASFEERLVKEWKKYLKKYLTMLKS